ncbi:MAG: hypothetical protein PVJ57_20205 [Phycisphaerae bacterium]
MRFITGSLVGLCLIVGGCAQPTASPGDTLPRLSGTVPPIQELFSAGAAILEGVDPPGPDQQWTVGDREFFGVLLETGETWQIRYVLLTLKTDVLPPEARVIVRPAGAAPTTSGSSSDVVQVVHPYGWNDGAAQREFTAKTWDIKYKLRFPQGTRIVRHSSRAVLVAVDVFDENAHWLETSYVMAPESRLRNGMFGVTATMTGLYERLGARLNEEMKEHPQDYIDVLVDHTSLLDTVFVLSNTLWACHNLVPLLEAAVRKPSLLSVILHFGVRYSYSCAVERFGRVDTSWIGLDEPALCYPLRVDVNGARCIDCDLLVVEPRPPLQLAAGVVGLDAVQPEDPSHRLTVRLLAARCGAGTGSLESTP